MNKIPHFTTNDQKVKYIADHLITLQNILSNDAALATMLVDMINRAMWGPDTPSIVPGGKVVRNICAEPDDYVEELLMLPPRPDQIEEKNKI